MYLMSKSVKIVLLPGDGIGVEVMNEGVKVLDVALEAAGLEADYQEIPCGGQYYLEHGVDWPAGSQEACRNSDICLLGAVGWPDPEGSGPVLMDNGKMAGYSPVIGNRVNLELYANVRPVKLFPGASTRFMASTLLYGAPRRWTWSLSGKTPKVSMRGSEAESRDRASTK
jgi:3-isopropylmalate dehydrogenase